MIRTMNSDMSSFAAFWDDSITCWTQDAGGKICGAVALSTLSALLLLLAQAALGYERCRYRVESGREALASLYSLLGNICSTVGAILSRQLHLQVVLGAFSAAVDVMAVITLCLPMCLCWNSKAERKLRARRRRRRQHLLEVCVLMVVAGGFLKVGLSKSEIDRAPIQRRLLQVISEDNAEILGYILGILSFAIAYTARFPAVYRAHKKQIVTRAQMFSGLLCSLAGACYASAILLYDTSNAFIWRTLPWLLSAVLCAIMDLLIVLIHLCKRTTTIQRPVVFSPDTESLLKNSVNAVKEKPSEEKIHLIPQIKKKNVEKAAGIDCYLDVNSPPERKCPIEITLSRTEKKKEGLASNSVRGEDDSFCSSDTSDSSVVSSDLEWDFEEANIQWCEPASKAQKRGRLPLQV